MDAGGVRLPRADSDVTDEQVATNGVYLEPAALGELTTTLQMACRRAYKKQLELDDEKAAASSQVWPFGYFCLLVGAGASAALCNRDWR